MLLKVSKLLGALLILWDVFVIAYKQKVLREEIWILSNLFLSNSNNSHLLSQNF